MARRASRYARSAVWSAAVCCAFGWAGCDAYPDLDKRWNDDIVATSYDPDMDFGKPRTFTVEPTVYLVKDLQDGGVGRDELPASAAEPIVARVARNMREHGYTEVSVEEGPDLGLSLTAVNAKVSGTSSWWWCGSYWGYRGWGCYYPFYVHYSYRTGSLVTDMLDLSRPLPELPDGGLPNPDAGVPEQPIALPVVWSSVAYQVLDGKRPDVQWATESIDQAFAQSPYLERK